MHMLQPMLFNIRICILCSTYYIEALHKYFTDKINKIKHNHCYIYEFFHFKIILPNYFFSMFWCRLQDAPTHFYDVVLMYMLECCASFTWKASATHNTPSNWRLMYSIIHCNIGAFKLSTQLVYVMTLPWNKELLWESSLDMSSHLRVIKPHTTTHLLFSVRK